MKIIDRKVDPKLREDVLTQALSNSISYAGYREMVSALAQEGKSTGPNQTEALANYTILNDRRMKRWDKVLKFNEASVLSINKVQEKIEWLVLTESWCGDAAPALPVMNKIAELNPNIQLKIVLRDENPALMQQYLTDGAMSIPKLIQRNKNTNEVLGTWGPRSSKATQLVNDQKAAHGMLSAAFKEDLQQWYNKDKGRSIVHDLLELLPLK